MSATHKSTVVVTGKRGNQSQYLSVWFTDRKVSNVQSAPKVLSSLLPLLRNDAIGTSPTIRMSVVSAVRDKNRQEAASPRRGTKPAFHLSLVAPCELKSTLPKIAAQGFEPDNRFCRVHHRVYGAKPHRRNTVTLQCINAISVSAFRQSIFNRREVAFGSQRHFSFSKN